MKESTKRILKLARNPKFISGIYNYCDRWCERCALTDRCMNFAMTEERLQERKEKDLTDKDFLQEMKTIFQETLDFIRDLSNKQGIDIDKIPPDPAFEKRERDRFAGVRRHILSVLSFQYTKSVRDWFANSRVMYKKKLKEFLKNCEMDIEPKKNIRNMRVIADAVEVIQWYNVQIHVKCTRALLGRNNEIRESAGYPSDADGSMKVALIGMDNSIRAWEHLKKNFPQKEDEIIGTLALLQSLRKKAEKHFPKARDFVRPGFDTEKGM